VTIFDAQKPSWSQGREYPVTPKLTEVTERSTPETQMSSLGLEKPPVRNTLEMCKRIAKTMREDDHL
jgi:hypothetical protein